MKLSDYVIDFLVSKGVGCVFEVCGGAITHLLDSLHGRDDIEVVSTHHEQAAAFAAEGYSRAGGAIGVAMATSGPGATNLITGIASCYFDSIPALFITGQVNTYEFKFNLPVRQVGFQETDIVNIIKPVVKEAVLVTEPTGIRYILERAFHIAKSGRPGPVLIDIPMNIQRHDIDPGSVRSFVPDEKAKGPDIKRLREAAALIKSAKRPAIVAGGGIASSGASEELAEFVKKSAIPVCTSLMGLDALGHEDEFFVGMIGTYGNRYANLTVASADLVLAIGTRLDTRQTGTRPETFARNARIVHVDIDPSELNNKIKGALTINCDAGDFLREMNIAVGELPPERLKSWHEAIRRFKERFPSYSAPTGKDIGPNFFIHKLSSFIPENAVICADVGQNQMWSAQSLELKGSQRFFTQGGMGSMGSSLAMAIGASYAAQGRRVVVITGDGGFQLNMQELQTLYHNKLPVKIVLLNNRCYGMIRQFQEQYFSGKFQSSIKGYSQPDFQRVVPAYGIPSSKIERHDEIDAALGALFKNESPAFLEVVIKSESRLEPKLAVNMPIESQDPQLSDKEKRALGVGW